MSRSSRAASNSNTPCPTSLQALTIPPHLVETRDGDSILLWDSSYTVKRRRSFLFSTPPNLRILGNCDNLVVDGTFKVPPGLFSWPLLQASSPGLFSWPLHAAGYSPRYHWRPILPSTRLLLPGKRTAHNQNLFGALVEALDPHFCPDTILCDYELGLRSALGEIYPSSTIRGCSFHFKQAIFKKFKQFDLVEEYHIVGSPIRRIGAQCGDVIDYLDAVSVTMDILTIMFETFVCLRFCNGFKFSITVLFSDAL